MYSVRGHWFYPDEAAFEDALRDAQLLGVRPLCMCTDDGIPVYVSTLPGRHTVKRLPFTGGLHSPTCPHRWRTKDLPHLGAVQRDPETGSLLLRVSFALASGSRPSRRETSSECRHRLFAPRSVDRLGLLGLLRLLWEEADLMRWHKSFEGKRTWWVVRSRLLRAASKMSIGITPLADVLFIPEAFSAERVAKIAARRASKFAAVFEPRAEAQRRMLLVGEVKRFVWSDCARAAIIKHLPDLPFECQPGCDTNPLGDILPSQDPVRPEQHAIAIGTFTWDSEAGARMHEVEFLLMSREWLPLQTDWVNT